MSGIPSGKDNSYIYYMLEATHAVKRNLFVTNTLV